MDVIKLGKKGQLSLPAAVLRKMGIQGAATDRRTKARDGRI